MVQPVTYGSSPLPLPNLGAGFAQAGQALGEAFAASRQAAEADMYRRDLQDAMQSGDPQAFARLAGKYPDQAQSIKASFGVLSQTQQQNELVSAAEAYNAIQSGNINTAKTLVDNRILAAQNAGQNTDRLEAIRRTLDSDPSAVTKNLDMIMYAIAPEQWSQMTGAPTDLKVQSSEILDDGTVVSVMKDGSRQVTDRFGNRLTGREAAQAIEQAQETGVRIAGERAGRADAMKRAQDIAQKAFERTEKIQTNINNLDKVVRLIDQGANTGRIANLAPDWNASTIALRNVQNQLGLDVVGSVTFGALSESELNLALQTGLPTNLDEPELKQWAINKKRAQQKLLGYLNEQARFLSRDDTTLNDWLDLVEKRKKAREEARKNVPDAIKGKSYMNVLGG